MQQIGGKVRFSALHIKLIWANRAFHSEGIFCVCVEPFRNEYKINDNIIYFFTVERLIGIGRTNY